MSDTDNTRRPLFQGNVEEQKHLGQYGQAFFNGCLKKLFDQYGPPQVIVGHREDVFWMGTRYASSTVLMSIIVSLVVAFLFDRPTPVGHEALATILGEVCREEIMDIRALEVFTNPNDVANAIFYGVVTYTRTNVFKALSRCINSIVDIHGIHKRKPKTMVKHERDFIDQLKLVESWATDGCPGDSRPNLEVGKRVKGVADRFFNTLTSWKFFNDRIMNEVVDRNPFKMAICLYRLDHLQEIGTRALLEDDMPAGILNASFVDEPIEARVSTSATHLEFSDINIHDFDRVVVILPSKSNHHVAHCEVSMDDIRHRETLKEKILDPAKEVKYHCSPKPDPNANAEQDDRPVISQEELKRIWTEAGNTGKPPFPIIEEAIRGKRIAKPEHPKRQKLIMKEKRAAGEYDPPSPHSIGDEAVLARTLKETYGGRALYVLNNPSGTYDIAPEAIAWLQGLRSHGLDAYLVTLGCLQKQCPEGHEAKYDAYDNTVVCKTDCKVFQCHHHTCKCPCVHVCDCPCICPCACIENGKKLNQANVCVCPCTCRDGNCPDGACPRVSECDLKLAHVKEELAENTAENPRHRYLCRSLACPPGSCESVDCPRRKGTGTCVTEDGEKAEANKVGMVYISCKQKCFPGKCDLRPRCPVGNCPANPCKEGECRGTRRALPFDYDKVTATRILDEVSEIGH